MAPRLGVMLRFVSLSLAFAASVQAQDVPPDRRPSTVQRSVLVVGSIAGAAGALAGTYALIPSWYDTPAGVSLLILAYPVGMAAGTVLASDALGLQANPRDVLADSFLGVPAGALAGAVVAVVVGGGIYLLTMDVDYNIWPGLIGGGLGIIATVGVSSTVATRRVRAAPAVLRAPTGESAPGLRLRLSF